MTLQDFYYPPNGTSWYEGIYTVSADGTKTPVSVTGEWVIEAISFADAIKEEVWTVTGGLIQSGQFFGGAGSLMCGGPIGVKIGEHVYPLDAFELVATYDFSGGYHITFDAHVSGSPNDNWKP
jgi:hypothetical protein